MALSAGSRARRRRAPLMALAVLALFAGLWGGLIRLGLAVPTVVTSAGELHGPLMALGFLGTLVSLERAVALDRAWAYVAPLAAGLGSLAALSEAPDAFGPALLTLAGLVLLAAHVVLHRLQPSAHNAVMGLGALAWCAAAVLWLTGADVVRFAPLMAGFLVATIVGERLELTRAVRRSLRTRLLLLAAIAVFAGGLVVSVSAERLGVRIARRRAGRSGTLAGALRRRPSDGADGRRDPVHGLRTARRLRVAGVRRRAVGRVRGA